MKLPIVCGLRDIDRALQHYGALGFAGRAYDDGSGEGPKAGTARGRSPPKAVASLRRDFEKLLTFFDFPAEHWKHLRTTNIIESPFATVRLRQRVTKGPGSRTKAITMTFKLLEMAEKRRRRLNGHELLPLVAHGVKCQDGIQVENKEERAA